VSVPLAGIRFVRPLGIIQRRHSKLSSTALRFIDILRHHHEINGLGDLSGEVPVQDSRFRHGRPALGTSRNGVAVVQRKKKGAK
jgi:hypothetical protein